MLVRLLALLFFSGLLKAAELPAGIKACKNDKNFNACADKASVNVIRNIIKGDKKYKIPVLDPLYIEKITMFESKNKSVALNLTLEHINIAGLETTTFKSEMDVPKHFVKWTFKVKGLKFLSEYEVDGKFLLVPIIGKGKADVNIIEPVIVFTTNYTLKDKKGKKYLVQGPSTVNFQPKKITLHLDNLFNGDKVLGENVNKVLNENWKDISDRLGPGIISAIKKILEGVLHNVLEMIPYDELILP